MGSRVAWLLVNARYRSVTGEELGLHFRPMDFVEAFGPATLDALKAIGNRKVKARILTDLYGSQGEEEMLGMLLRASVCEGSEAMRAAFLRTLGESGSKAIGPFRRGLSDEDDAVDYLFEGVQAAIKARGDSPGTLGLVRNAISEVLDATDDRDAADALVNALQTARQQERAAAVATLLAGCAEALSAAADPWSILGALVEGLCAPQGWVINTGSTAERFWRHFQAEVANEDPERLWQGYLWSLSRLWAVDTEDGLSVASAYRTAVMAVTDSHWVADRLLEICEMGFGSDYSLSWLPDRDEAILACVSAIRVVEGSRAAEQILAKGFRSALEYDPEEAVESLLDATREAVRVADDPVEAVGVLVDGLCGAEPEWPPSWWEG